LCVHAFVVKRLATRAKNVILCPMETDLYYPVKKYFTALGYDVKSEVRGCDVIAVRDGELVIAEMKLQFGLTLLRQALERQKLTPLVYVAVPRPRNISSKTHRQNEEIARRLGLGLLLVALDSPVPRAEAAVLPAGADGGVRPAPKPATRAGRKKAQILAEAAGRTGDYNTGGSANRMIYTVYREKAVKIACALSIAGQANAPELIRWFGCDKRANLIMRNNFRGWFEKADRGRYALSRKGLEFLRENRDNEVVAYYMRECENTDSNMRGDPPCV